jgi:hypothetical protein
MHMARLAPSAMSTRRSRFLSRETNGEVCLSYARLHALAQDGGTCWWRPILMAARLLGRKRIVERTMTLLGYLSKKQRRPDTRALGWILTFYPDVIEPMTVACSWTIYSAIASSSPPVPSKRSMTFVPLFFRWKVTQRSETQPETASWKVSLLC